MTNTLVWLRNDLRMKDNPLFDYVIKNKRRILPVFVIDSNNNLGPSSKWWLYKSIKSLSNSMNDNLLVLDGETEVIIKQLIKDYRIEEILWGRRYNPEDVAIDRDIQKFAKNQSVEVKIFETSLLANPSEILKKDGTPFRVYTHFYKQKYQDLKFESLVYNNNQIQFLPINQSNSINSVESKMLEKNENWYKKFEKYWNPGEEGAHKKLKSFIEFGIDGYSDGRNRPDKNHVSMLSPHLRFGEISPQQIITDLDISNNNDAEIFYKELVWREFSHHLLYHFPQIVSQNLQNKFDNFPWILNKDHLKKWQRGKTGFPIVDAGMRQLWETGYMHNRVRMIVGSFLVKNLLIDWRHGRDWFNYTLVDADTANNNASWQWVAGSGADAAPYFRIFNPITQGKKFDPQGKYVRKFVPELIKVPDKYIHEPWLYKKDLLSESNSNDADAYPLPVVSLSESRERALSAFKTISLNNK